MPIQFIAHLDELTTPLTHNGETIVGSGHAPLALRAD